MKRVLVFLFFLSSSLSFAQERNYAQELVDFLLQNRCIEARELHLEHADKLVGQSRSLDLLYNALMGRFFNKPDTFSFYIREFFSNHDYQLQLGQPTNYYYWKLLRIYGDNQQFEAGIELCDEIIDLFKRNPFNLDHEFVKNDIIFAEKMKSTLKERAINEPLIKIDRSYSKDSVIKLYENDYIRFDAKYNGVEIETWFDTGCNHYFFISKSLADKIGVKVINKNQDSTQMLNGVQIKAYEGVIDSIDLKSVKLYNIPVLVFSDKLTVSLNDTLFDDDERTKIEKIFTDKQILMGIPVMKLIGKIEFDWDQNTISFPGTREYKSENNSSNIFLIDDRLFLNLKINGLSYSGFLDSGSNDFINMRYSFYEKNINHIEVMDSIAKQKSTYFSISWTGSSFNLPYDIVTNAKVYFRGESINHNIKDVLVVDNPTIFNSLDGFVGIRFLKRLTPGIIIDFNNMEIQYKN